LTPDFRLRRKLWPRVRGYLVYDNYMTIKEIIKKSISEICHSMDFAPVEFGIERPADDKMGDYSSNVAMILAKIVDENPRDLAESIVAKLRDDDDLSLVIDTDRIEVAGPGFVNFFIRDEYLSLFICQDKIYNDLPLKSRRVLVEYSSPNIAKRFSVGHLRSTIIGNAIERMYRHLGARVTNDNHLGDWGTQFGMIIAAIEEKGLDVSKMSVADLENEYVEFNKRIADDPNLKDKAREAFARLEAGDDKTRKIWQSSVDVSMQEFEGIYEKLNVQFERSLGESVYEADMPHVIEEAKNKGVAVEGEKGAWIVKFEKDGKECMPPAMLVKSDGTTTYFTRDLATIKWRLEKDDLMADLYIYEVGGEQRLHLKQVFETARMVWDKAREVEFVHVAHGMMTLPEGKMSTRKGNTIKLDELLERACDEARARIEIGKDGEKDSLAEQMGINAVKYNELKRSPGADYVFRWEEALSMEGNSAPYINYAFVRANRIINEKKLMEFGIFFEGEERDLARWLMRFGEGEVVMDAAKNFAPQQLCAYLFETAKRFNVFYDHNRVLGDERESTRLALVAKTAEVLKTGMSVLGIEMVKEM
jgi:arginyl-tRNA synthetase